MSALPFDTPIPLEAQIAEVQREIAMRERCYAKWVSERRMLQKHADKYLDSMRAVLQTLESLKAKGGG